MSDRETIKRHPIQVAARRAGLTPHVLRAWEKRYGDAIAPGRTEGGRRLYSDVDVERLTLLRTVTQAGRRIGDVAGLGLDELRGLAEEDRSTSRPRSSTDVAGRTPATRRLVDEGLAAIHALDTTALRQTMRAAMVRFPAEAFVNDVVSPLMHAVGDMWWNGELTPSHEHAASFAVIGALSDLMGGLGAGHDAPQIVVATPSGQRHEIGAMLVAIAAATEGWGVVYLGADLPGGAIARAVEQSGADAVALSLVHPEASPESMEAIRELVDQLPRGVSLLVGGPATDSYRDVLGAAARLQDLDEFRTALREAVDLDR